LVALLGAFRSFPELVRTPSLKEWRKIMSHVIVEPCVGIKDKSCVEVCPVECIYDGGDQFYIHPDECIDCGACVPACPVSAIYPEEDVPEQWYDYIAKNRKLSGLE
jgi:NAD-dependent dihydropyrimidine dehydrogenase PreA subunit